MIEVFAQKIVTSTLDVEKLPEYQTLKTNLKAYQKLFKLLYLEHVQSLPLLKDELGCGDLEEVQLLISNLYKYFCVVMDGEVRGDKLVLVCPECLKMGLINYSRLTGEIPRVCRLCGTQLDGNYVTPEDFDTSIEFGQTFQPTSFLSWTKGLGNTFDHKKYLHTILPTYGEDFGEFKKGNPALAEALQHNFVVVSGDFAFHLMDEGMNVVRKVPTEDLFNSINGLFHAQDKPLRKTKADYSSKTHSEYQAPLAYATTLIERYKINVEEPKNQALLNNLGIDIRVFRTILKAQHLHVPVKSFVETLFLINLLIHGRTELATEVEHDLEIHGGFAEYYGSFKGFMRDHQNWNTSETGLINALKCIQAQRKTA